MENKFLVLVCLGLLLGVVGCRQKEPGTITVTGEVKGLPEGMVKLYTYPPSNLLLDSCEIKDGKYFLKGKIDTPQMGMLCFEVKPEYQEHFLPMLRIFLEPADIKMYNERDNMKGSWKMENCPLNTQLVACEKYLKSLPEYKRAADLTDTIQVAFYEADMVKVRSYSVVRDSLYLVLIDRLFEKVENAPRNEVVAWLVSQYGASLSGNEVAEIVERFDPAFRSSFYVAKMQEFAANDQHLDVGKLFPDFQVFDPTGKNYTLADFQGKYLFVEFSASWCGWCKKEIPHIRKAYEQLKDRNIVFITMMMDTDRNQWCRDIEKEGIEWLCLSDLKGMKKSPLAESYNLRGLPDSFVVDPGGYIIRRDLRGGEVLDFLSQITQEN